MKYLPVALIVFFSTVSHLIADPFALGDYIGTLRTTKTLAPGSPAIVTTVRLVARVSDGGVLTLLPAIPQSAAQAIDPESAASRIAPDVQGIYRLDGRQDIGLSFSFDGTFLRVRAVNDPQADPQQVSALAVGPRSIIEATLRFVPIATPNRR